MDDGLEQKIVRLFDQTMAERNLSASQVAQSIQKSTRVVNHWRSGRHFSLSGIENALLCQGIKLDLSVTKESDGEQG